jgi:hypothetical protein
VVIAILRALEKLDDPAALPAVAARTASLAAGDKRLRFFKAALKSLGRHTSKAPKAKATKPSKAAAPQPVAPGLPLWYAPPALSAPRGDDPDLAALLAAMPAEDAQKKLAKRLDPATAAAVRARLLEAADGLCDYTWDEALVQTLAPALKGKARRAHTALYGPINERLALVRALAVDLARRWDPEGDAALVGLLAGHRHPALADELAPSLIEAEPSRALLEALASRIDDPRLGPANHRLLASSAHALFLLGEPRALEAARTLLGAKERRHLGMSLLQAASKHLDARSDRGWIDVIAADARVTPMPMAHFAART